MNNKKDRDVDILRIKANVSTLECAEFLKISYSSYCQRVGGYCNWQLDERESLIKFLEKRIKDNDSSM